MSAVPRFDSVPPSPAAPILGQSEVMRQVVDRVQRFAPTGLPILLVGATGTGKDLLAHYIHTLSGRLGELVDVNCGALPRDMVESLLFGHRRGAFTGAVADMPGLVMKAASGTLFLDELCSLGAEAQVKLLRVLESGQVRALGETRNVPVQFRLVSAVQEELAARLDSGMFREDLYHRIAGVVIHLPKLAERTGDVTLLAAHFATQHGRTLGKGAIPLLEQHSWPGNIRELRAVIARASLLTEEQSLDAAILTEALAQGPLVAGGAHRHALGTSRRLRLLAACAANDWDPIRIAEAMGVSRATLYRRLKDEGVNLRTLRSPRLSHPSRRSHSQ